VSGAESPYGNQVVDLEIDLDGSGQFELAASVPWARLTTGLLFSSEANTRPIITNLAINPPGATGEDELTAEYAAEDPDGDELSYGLFWIRNGNLLQTNAATLASINFSKGDLIELR